MAQSHTALRAKGRPRGREFPGFCARIAPLNPPPAPPRRGAITVGQFPSWEGSGVGWLAPGSWAGMGAGGRWQVHGCTVRKKSGEVSRRGPADDEAAASVFLGSAAFALFSVFATFLAAAPGVAVGRSFAGRPDVPIDRVFARF